MSITLEAARSEAADALAQYDAASVHTVLTTVPHLAFALRQLLSVLPEPPTTDDREALAEMFFHAENPWDRSL